MESNERKALIRLAELTGEFNLKQCTLFSQIFKGNDSCFLVSGFHKNPLGPHWDPLK